MMVSCVRMNKDCLDKQSTMTRMDVYPEDDGSCSMKSMEMEFQGFSGIGSCFRRPYGLCHWGFVQEQMVHDLQ